MGAFLGLLALSTFLICIASDDHNTANERSVYRVAAALTSTMCLFAGFFVIPYSIKFYPEEQRFVYSIGFGLLAYRRTGFYSKKYPVACHGPARLWVVGAPRTEVRG